MQPVYRSTDSSAPALSNTNGSLVAVLDAVLVNGYGAKSGLGWTIEHTATNKRVYKQGAGSSGFSLRVDDSGNVYNAKARGGESFSDVDTVSGGFPTAAQLTDGIYIQKTINTAGNRPWVIWGDAKRFVLIVDVHNNNTNFNGFYFGDIVSFKAGDAFNCVIAGKHESRTDTNSAWLGVIGAHLFSNQTAHYIARAYTGVGSAIQVGVYADGRIVSGRSGWGTAGTNVLPYPDPVSGGLHLSRLFISESAGGQFAPRGYLPGIWAVLHDRNAMISSGCANGDTFSGTDGLASRSFEYRFSDINNQSGAIAIETSDWPESA